MCEEVAVGGDVKRARKNGGTARPKLGVRHQPITSSQYPRANYPRYLYSPLNYHYISGNLSVFNMIHILHSLPLVFVYLISHQFCLHRYNMYGPDVFAVLSPYPGRYWAHTLQAFGHPSNTKWLDRDLLVSRESTPALSSSDEIGDQTVNRLFLKYEHLTQVNMIQIGTDEKASTDEKVAHISLKFPGVKAVSARHCIIAIRSDNVIYLEDQYSRFGTRILYDGQEEKGRQQHGVWDLTERPGVPKRWDEVVVCTGNLAWTIEFPNHPFGSVEYIEMLEKFRVKQDTEVSLFGALGLHSNATTALPSQSVTPHGRERPIYLRIRTIKSSSSGTVELMLNTRDETHCVKKTILTYPKVHRKRKRDMNAKMRTEYEKAREVWFADFRSRMAVLQSIDHVSATAC